MHRNATHKSQRCTDVEMTYVYNVARTYADHGSQVPTALTQIPRVTQTAGRVAV